MLKTSVVALSKSVRHRSSVAISSSSSPEIVHCRLKLGGGGKKRTIWGSPEDEYMKYEVLRYSHISGCASKYLRYQRDVLLDI